AEYLQTLGIDVWVPRASLVAQEHGPAAPAAEGGPEAGQVAGEPPAALAPSCPPQPAHPGAGAAWKVLRSEVLGCTRCGLHATRTQGVVGVGNPRAEGRVIGEAPGAEEDRRGEPFVGRAGQLQEAMPRASGLRRAPNDYIATVLDGRPPNNRDARPGEV